jgi:hypothetical protein
MADRDHTEEVLDGRLLVFIPGCAEVCVLNGAEE